uniref:Importin N-terminal domain-containing protein n=1 Tax=Neolamprologus brichardi TaxID=32507 RepID=A0A3Q4HG51_NEOBR
MDPDALVEALRGTMDPNLREAAERQLNEVKVKILSDCPDFSCCFFLRDKRDVISPFCD